MSGSLNMNSEEVKASKDLIDCCMALFDGKDTAVVLGVLTSLVTLTLDDTGVPLDVFVAALRGSEAKLVSMRRARKRR